MVDWCGRTHHTPPSLPNMKKHIRVIYSDTLFDIVIGLCGQEYVAAFMDYTNIGSWESIEGDALCVEEEYVIPIPEAVCSPKLIPVLQNSHIIHEVLNHTAHDIVLVGNFNVGLLVQNLVKGKNVMWYPTESMIPASKKQIFTYHLDAHGADPKYTLQCAVDLIEKYKMVASNNIEYINMFEPWYVQGLMRAPSPTSRFFKVCVHAVH